MVSIEVPGAASPATAAAAAARLLAPAAWSDAAAPVPADRVERTGAPRAIGSLAALAATRPAGAARRTRYVHHGALRVPVSADAAFTRATRYLARDPEMRGIIARVERARTTYTLRIVHHDQDGYDAATRTVVWDPHSALRTTAGGRQSPALGLGHELDHAAEAWRQRRAGEATRVARYDDAEERRVIRGSEQHAARTLGEASRDDHRGTCYKVVSPTAV